MSDSEKPNFLGLEGMLQDLGANSGKARSAPPPPSPDDEEPATLEPATLDRKKTARETPVAKTPKPPPLPLIAYDTPSPSSSRRQLDRGDPVAAIEPYSDVQDSAPKNEPIEPAPLTEMSPATQPVTSTDLEKEGPKSELAKTRVSAVVSVPPSDKPLDSKPEPSIPVALVTDSEKKPILSAREALEGGPKKAKRDADPAAARFPTLQALDTDADKPKSGMWFAIAAILVAGGLAWYFTRNRVGGEETAAHPTETATVSASASVHPTTSAPPASASAVASALATSSASAAPSASVAPSATATVPATAGGAGAGATTHATATHATSRPTVTATAPPPPPPPTTATATTPPPPPTSTKPSLINEP